MKNFVHGCHLIATENASSQEGPYELWQCVDSDQVAWRKDGTKLLLFTSLFRADQYLRQTQPAKKNYLHAKISSTEVASKFSGLMIVVNPCAFCDHHITHEVMEKNISQALHSEFQIEKKRSEIYLQDAKLAMSKKNSRLAIESLLVIVEHLAPDMVEAHSLLLACAQDINDSALLKTAQINLAALKP